MACTFGLPFGSFIVSWIPLNFLQFMQQRKTKTETCCLLRSRCILAARSEYFRQLLTGAAGNPGDAVPREVLVGTMQCPSAVAVEVVR